MQTQEDSHSEPDPFASCMEERPPLILSDLDDPLEAPPGVAVRQLVFASRGAEGNEVYAVIARPAAAGTYPGLLLLHGGMGCAEVRRGMAWASRGYVTLTIDIPTVAKAEAAPRSSGAWKSLPYEKDRWRVTDKPSDTALYQGVVAVMEALWLLRAQPGVDRQKIGVHGISWGGYLTAMACALGGARVKAGFSVYGSGHYEECRYRACMAELSEADRERWYRRFDAARRAPRITADYFIAAATNDQAFWPPAVEKTLAGISGPVNRLHAPNANHLLPVPGGSADGTDNWAEMAGVYFAHLLKGEGGPLPAVRWETGSDCRDNLRFRIAGGRPPFAVTLYYSTPGIDWREREWRPVVAREEGGSAYCAGIPADAPGEIDCFALVSDSRPVSVSTCMRRIGTRARAELPPERLK